MEGAGGTHFRIPPTYAVRRAKFDVVRQCFLSIGLGSTQPRPMETRHWLLMAWREAALTRGTPRGNHARGDARVSRPSYSGNATRVDARPQRTDGVRPPVPCGRRAVVPKAPSPYSPRATRRRVPAWAPLVMVLLGAAVMAYPFVSNWFAEKNASRAIQKYGDAISGYSEEELAEAHRAAVEYNESLAGDPVHDPFVPGSGYALPSNYEDVLNLESDGVMGYIEIPKIDVRLPIYHGTSEEVLAKGVGHIEQTALPIGGDERHPVLTGHRGLPSAELFTRLDELEEGDEFYLHVLDDALAYRVDQIKTVEPDELADLTAESGHDWVTLVTCTPYAVNTHRLLVRGERTSYKDGAEGKAATSTGWRPSPYELGLAAGAGVLAIGAVAASVVSVRRRTVRHISSGSREERRHG